MLVRPSPLRPSVPSRPAKCDRAPRLQNHRMPPWLSRLSAKSEPVSRSPLPRPIGARPPPTPPCVPTPAIDPAATRCGPAAPGALLMAPSGAAVPIAPAPARPAVPGADMPATPAPAAPATGECPLPAAACMPAGCPAMPPSRPRKLSAISRSIPARAGCSLWLIARASAATVHPRARGADGPAPARMRGDRGTFPRVRGDSVPSGWSERPFGLRLSSRLDCGGRCPVSVGAGRICVAELVAVRR